MTTEELQQLVTPIEMAQLQSAMAQDMGRGAVDILRRLMFQYELLRAKRDNPRVKSIKDRVEQEKKFYGSWFSSLECTSTDLQDLAWLLEHFDA